MPVKTYPGGSEWRKWDLHVHSPASAMNNQFPGATIDEKWTRYLAKLSSITDVTVLGVTDYFSIDGYRKVAAAGLTNFDLILPNVELRIVPVTDTNTPLNLHLIFDPSIVDQLESQFFSSLEHHYSGDTYKCTRADLVRLGRAFKNDSDLQEDAAYRAGIEQFKTSVDSLRQIFGKNKTLASKALVVVSNKSHDGNSGIQHSSMASTREEIYRFAHAIFSANPSDRTFFLGKGTDSKDEVVRKYGSLKPCIHGSDAHDLEGVCRPCAKRDVAGHDCSSATDCAMRFCWIKADPTFEGFRQILFEPDDRVRIQDLSPYDDHKKLFFNRVSLEGSTNFILRNTALPLNRELVTIIGGRGSGKSVLLESIAFLNEEHLRIDQNGKKRVIEFYRDNEPRLEPPPSCLLKVTLVDKDGQSKEFQKPLSSRDRLELPFLYIGQEHLSGMATNDAEVTKTICQLIGIDPSELNQQDLIAQGREVLAQIRVAQQTVSDATHTFESLGYKQDQDFEKWIKAHIQKLTEQQQRLSSKDTKAALEEINLKTKKGLELKDLVSEATLAVNALSNLAVNETIRALNQKIKAIYPNVEIDSVDTKSQIEQLTALRSKANSDMDALRAEIVAKKAELNKQGIKEDVNTLIQSSEALQREIGAAEKAFASYLSARVEVEKGKTSRQTTLSSIVAALDELKGRLAAKFTDFKKSRDGSAAEEKELFQKIIAGIDIDGLVMFDQRTFCSDLLGSFVDNRKITNESELRRQIAGEEANGVAKPLTFDAVMGWVQRDFDGTTFFNRGGAERAMDYVLTEWPKFLRVKAVVRLGGKPIEVLSIGQRGTLLLKVYLSTTTARQIFVIDQPEDNLDNNFIMTELVPLIRQAKKSRQILMSTHNANLVVNADADQVVVARLDLGKPYLSGSIENPEINKCIREVLEGGEEAFRQRERKYGLGAN